MLDLLSLPFIEAKKQLQRKIRKQKSVHVSVGGFDLLYANKKQTKQDVLYELQNHLQMAP